MFIRAFYQPPFLLLLFQPTYNPQMATIHQLTKENLLQILGHLDKRSLKNCIRVSKKWQQITTQTLFEEVTLSYQIHKIKALLEENLPNQYDYFNKLQWIKRFCIEFGAIVGNFDSAFRNWIKERLGLEDQRWMAVYWPIDVKLNHKNSQL